MYELYDWHRLWFKDPWLFIAAELNVYAKHKSRILYAVIDEVVSGDNAAFTFGPNLFYLDKETSALVTATKINMQKIGNATIDALF